MTKLGNKNNKEKCKAYKASGRREANKKRKALKLEKHLQKCQAKYGKIRAAKEEQRKAALSAKLQLST
jgi:hypothetical protein